VDLLQSIWHGIEWLGQVILGRHLLAPDEGFSLSRWLLGRAGLIIIGVTLLETLFPLEERRFSRRNWLTVTYFILAAKAGILVLVVVPFIQAVWVQYHLPTVNLDKTLHPAVYWMVALLVVNLVDYWAHRLMHQIPAFWHIHKVHHATEQLNWGSNYHRHFAMGIVATPLITVTTLLLGTHLVPPFGLIHMTVEHLQHANIRIRFGWLNYLVALPEVHRYHHSKDPRHYNTNFAGGFVIWDQVFGTYHYDPRAPATDFGINEPMPTRYFGQQIQPFVWIARDIARHLPFPAARRWAASASATGPARGEPASD